MLVEKGYRGPEPTMEATPDYLLNHLSDKVTAIFQSIVRWYGESEIISENDASFIWKQASDLSFIMALSDYSGYELKKILDSYHDSISSLRKKTELLLREVAIDKASSGIGFDYIDNSKLKTIDEDKLSALLTAIQFCSPDADADKKLLDDVFARGTFEIDYLCDDVADHITVRFNKGRATVESVQTSKISKYFSKGTERKLTSRQSELLRLLLDHIVDVPGWKSDGKANSSWSMVMDVPNDTENDPIFSKDETSIPPKNFNLIINFLSYVLKTDGEKKYLRRIWNEKRSKGSITNEKIMVRIIDPFSDFR